MNVLDIYRYFRNYMTLIVSGGFTERFINLCNRRGIYLWDSHYHNGELNVKIYCRDFRKLHGIKHKSGVSIRVAEKIGIAFFVRENKKRKVLATGLVIAMLVMLAMNSFVWSIEVTGNENISEKEISQMLKASGLEYGAFVPAFDESKASRDAVNLSDGKILWLAINIKGSKATVEVRDYIKPIESSADSEPCNIIADFDGIILSSYTHRGVQIQHSGAAVKKGDLLISGIAENESGAVDYLSADGEITAIHSDVLSMDFTEKTNKSIITDLSYSFSLNIFGVNLPLNLEKNNNADSYSYTAYMTFDGNTLPIGTTKTAIKDSIVTADKKTELLESTVAFTNEEYSKFKNSRITASDYTITKNTNGINISGVYECIDFIGSKVPIIKYE